MGVHGLWKLVEPSGKIVPLDTLENKVLAVDVSIWLHQALKGFQDARGNAVPNAHLLGLFHRICKLLFYKIKPVFVFDGGIPHLKKQTVAARRQQKSKAEQKSEQAREKLLKNIIKHKALRKALGLEQHAGDVDLADARSKPAAGDMFDLPPMQQHLSENSGNEQVEDEDDALEEVLHGQHYKDLHSINVNSADFKALPANVRYDILSELKETRKQSSWGRLHEIPKESGDFSTYQMTRLLKRRSVQVTLEETEKEMGGRTLSLGELEELLCDQGVVLTPDLGKRIASDNVTRYLYIKDSQDSESKKSSQADSSSEVSELCSSPEKPGSSKSVLSLKVKATETAEIKDVISCAPHHTGNMILHSVFSSDEEQDELGISLHDPRLQLARDFMMENSSLTQEQILSFIRTQNIPDVSTSNASEMSSPTSKSESVVDSKTVDLENLGVTQKEILAMIQDELERCKKDLEVFSKGQFGESASDIVNIDENETMNPSSPCPSLIVDASPNINAPQDSQSSTSNLHLCSNIQTSPSHAERRNDSPKIDEITIRAQMPEEEEKLTSDTSEDDFVEVTELQVNCDVEIHRKSHKPNNTVSPVPTKTRVAVDDDIFSDVFQNANTKELDEIVGKLKKPHNTVNPVHPKTKVAVDDDIFGDVFQNGDTKEPDEIVGKKPQQVAFAEPVIENCVSNAVVEKMVALNNISSEEKVVKIDSTGKKPDYANIALEVDSMGKSNRVVYGIEDEVKIVPSSENHNAEEGVISAPKPAERLNLQELRTLEVDLEKEQTSLLAEKGKQERLAASITDQMYLEAQELLQLFGLPYIVAPMEAEAQCAFLDLMSMTDGTITDDSDIWLFGGQRVYKNFFNQKKQVLQFQATDIHHYFKLNRQQLILLALLVGSDYTIGLPGVGPVTALEILGAFPCKQLDYDSQSLLQGLKMFKDWLKSGIGAGPGKGTLRSKLKNVPIQEGFPSMSVVEAYMHPEVDESQEAFSWGMPDLLSLQNYARRKFSWTSKKADEILLPVLKRLSEAKSQKSIDSYFKVETVLQAADGKMSKRVQQAVRQIGGESTHDCEEPSPKRPRKVRIRKTQSKKPNTQAIVGLQGNNEDSVQDNVTRESSGDGEFNLPGTSGNNGLPGKEFIPQRERGKANSLRNKMKAIEVFRKSKFGLDRTKRDRRAKRQILKEAYLSESSSESN